MNNLIVRLLPKQVIADIIIEFLCSGKYQDNLYPSICPVTLWDIAGYLKMDEKEVSALFSRYQFVVPRKGEGE